MPGTYDDAHDKAVELQAETGRDKKNRTLMDLATIGAKALKQRGILQKTGYHYPPR